MTKEELDKRIDEVTAQWSQASDFMRQDIKEKLDRLEQLYNDLYGY